MPSGALFLARIAVVDHDHESALKIRRCAHKILCFKRDLNPFPGFRMDRVAVEELDFFRRRNNPCLDKASVARIDAERPLRTNDFDR